MSGITRPVGGVDDAVGAGPAHPVLAQLGLVLLAALITAGVVVVTSTLVSRWT